MSVKNKTEIVQWSYDFIENLHLNLSDNYEHDERRFYNYLYPFSETYYGANTPVFLFTSHDFTKIFNRERFTARDGLISLSLFFQEQSPELISGKMVIHRDLWFIVPEDWKEKVEFFDIEADNVFNRKNLPKKIFLSGILNSTLADEDEFAEDLKYLSSVLGKENIQKMDIVGYFPNKRNDIWGNWEDENVVKFSKFIFENTKMDISFPDWAIIKAENNFSNCLYYEINRGHFIKDSYPMHMVLSRGGGLLEKPAHAEPLIKIKESRLSLYHKMNIYKLDEKLAGEYIDPFSDKHFNYFKTIMSKNFKHRKVGSHWESWFADYVKKYYKMKNLV